MPLFMQTLASHIVGRLNDRHDMARTAVDAAVVAWVVARLGVYTALNAKPTAVVWQRNLPRAQKVL